jgi:hypothetical protein
MKPAIRYVEYPTRRSGMRNNQRSRTTNVLIINQRPPIETVSDRDKRKMGDRYCVPLFPHTYLIPAKQSVSRGRNNCST